VEAGPAAPARGAAHDLGEGGGRLDAGFSAGLHDGAGDAPRRGLLAVAVDEICQRAFGRPVHHLRRRLPPAPVHSHVEGPCGLEAEPPLRGIELRGADPEVEKDAGRLLAAEKGGNLAVVSLDEPRPRGEGQERGPRPLERLPVAVDAEESPIGRAPPQQLDRVPAQAHGPVHVKASRPHGQ
jgi:hypothetical protein